MTLGWAQPSGIAWSGPGSTSPVTVEIDGRRHSRCYSPANAEGVSAIELTIARHDGGLVSEYLHRNARPGMAVGLSAPAGDFVLPAPLPRRLVLIAGGSGITPVMSMVRTLTARASTARSPCCTTCAAWTMPAIATNWPRCPIVRVLYGCTRGGAAT